MLRTVLTSILLAASVRSESMIEWLLSGDRISPELTMTRDLAMKIDRARLEGLMGQATGGLVMVMPTNQAWLENAALYEKLSQDTPAANKLRNDVLFAAGGEIDKVGGFEELLAYAETNDGVVDTAFGTPMKINANGSACIAEYDSDWNLVTSQCTNLRLPPMLFQDGALYFTDTILLPDSLVEEAGL